MLKIAIIGGTGYSGIKLLKYLNHHSKISSVDIFANSSAGKNLFEIFPNLVKSIDEKKINCSILSVDNLKFDYDAVFLALPRGESLKYVPLFYEKKILCVDLGGDFRLNDPSLYPKYYGYEHTQVELLKEKIYSLADLTEDYQNKKIISNPGCYPTSVLLALAPIAMNIQNEIESISVVSYSGTSGAGKSSSVEMSFTELFGDISAYKVNKHQHFPEIKQQLELWGCNTKLSFTTHLAPIAQGIYTTIVVYFNNKIDEKEIKDLYLAFYINSKYVRMRENPPHLKWVVNTNFCDIYVSVDDDKAVIISAIDNLIKGASGQAIQNFNKYFNFTESEGGL